MLKSRVLRVNLILIGANYCDLQLSCDLQPLCDVESAYDLQLQKLFVPLLSQRNNLCPLACCKLSHNPLPDLGYIKEAALAGGSGQVDHYRPGRWFLLMQVV
ncbi:hypothetical protein Bbelb_183680 [Branchiostoma belcheri]|nr:hypothetical protein Bbelb_183680 [Branchiostoma belcheri]